MNNFSIKTINAENIDNEHICCAIGDDKKNRERALLKKNWMKQCFKNGHTFKKIDVRGKVFIEYVPAEYAWFPIHAPDYVFIQCFWVSGQYKGLGLSKILLDACKEDVKNKNGIIAITTNKVKPFTVDKKYYLKHGFTVCDKAEPYFELVVLKFDKNAPDPKFSENVRKPNLKDGKGLTFYYSDLCPFTEAHVDGMVKAGQKLNLPVTKIKIETLEQARMLPTPFSIFSVFYNETFLTHELMLEGKFSKFLSNYFDKLIN